MATKKKLKKTKKNKAKQEKKVLVAQNSTKLIKRGRPKLSWHIKLKRAIKKYFFNLNKKIDKSIKKLNYQYISFFKRLKIKKGRGRKKLPFYIKWRRFFISTKEKITKKRKKIFESLQLCKLKFLKFFHLNKKVGRPKKKTNCLFLFNFDFFNDSVFSFLLSYL